VKHADIPLLHSVTLGLHAHTTYWQPSIHFSSGEDRGLSLPDLAAVSINLLGLKDLHP